MARGATPIVIETSSVGTAKMAVPADRVLHIGSLHLIVEVTDSGTRALTRYGRTVDVVD